jgi:uncharacterized protein Yka (UPF0111/DUF47 family)
MALFRTTDTVVLDLIEESGRNIQRATLLLRDLFAEYPERSDLARDLLLSEQEGDRITHDIIHRLNGGRNGKPPLDPADGHLLATALDDIVDYGEQVAQALRCLRSGAEIAPHLVEIHRLENEGDRLSRDAVASLFANGIDPMVVIRWKDIFETLEQSVDACEKVAHVLEGISLKRGKRR